MDSDKFGESESLRKCQHIMKDTGANIEISSAKDMTLTFVITGKHTEVAEARRKILIHFQQQSNKQISVPKEYHRFVLGKKGDRLKELEINTATKISLPNSSDESELVTITGTREGIDKAEHEIRMIVQDQSKKSVDTAKIPKHYHLFIAGPNNESLNALCEETDTKIALKKGDIMITGEKENVAIAKAKLEKIHQHLEKTCKTVSVEVPKAQQKYVIGPRGSTIQEIFRLTGVSVEVPPPEVLTDTIMLRGAQEKLGLALSTVYEKANSVRSATVDAPAWIHKHIRGPKWRNIRELRDDCPNVHIDLEGDKIKIDGPTEQVEKMQEEITRLVDDYKLNMSFREMDINPNFMKHIIGKAGANINRMQEEMGVSIYFEESAGRNVMRIEGPHQAIEQAEVELRERIDKLENEKEKDVIIDHRLFKKLIGAKGDNIKEIRDKYKKVQIKFPNPNENSDIVKIRGRKEEVDACHTHLMKVVKELQESSYILEVPIYKRLHKLVIGKGGANIKRIREETNTNIDLPAENVENDVILITGRRENVNEARDMILRIQSEQGDIVDTEIDIPHEYHQFMIGPGGKFLSAISDDCGGVTIKIPPADSKSDKVYIRGLADDVEKAKQQLLELSSKRANSSFTDNVQAKQQYHRFLIGKGGANIRKIRDQTDTYIIFPDANGPDHETITIIGTEKGVRDAKQQLENMVKDIDNTIEDVIEVDVRHHRHFMQRRRRIADKIAEDCGGVQIQFPRNGEDSNVVTLKGAKECIEMAKQRILEEVHEQENQVTIECRIPQKYHRAVMGSRGRNVQDITSRFDVQIKFPDRFPSNRGGSGGGGGGSTHDMDAGSVNGDNGSVMNGGGDPVLSNDSDAIKITATPEKCAAARDALLGLIQEVSVPFEMHKLIIGHKGQTVRELMQQFDVYIELSPPIEKQDLIKVIGDPAAVEEAKIAIAKKVEEFELDRKDRELRSFELLLDVDPAYHIKIIGRKGAVINQIRADCDVQIRLPRGQNESTISITGYEEATHKARDAIMAIVNDLEQMVKEVLELDHRIYPRLIGQRGRNIRKIMDDYKVEVVFPRPEDANQNAVTLIGSDDNVIECKNYILNLEEEYMQELADAPTPQARTMSEAFEEVFGRGHGNQQEGGKPKGFVVKGAPWQGGPTPNTSSKDEFPEFGGMNSNNSTAHNAESGAFATAWGPPR